MTAAHVAGFSRLLLATAALEILLDTPTARGWGVVIVALAGLTDILDGFLARRFKTVSTFGVFLDLTADKVFVAVLLVSLVQLGRVPAILAALILAREFIVMGLRTYAAAEGLVVPARALGATKTVFLFTGSAVALLADQAGTVLLWVGAVFAYLSGATYCRQVFRFSRDLPPAGEPR